MAMRCPNCSNEISLDETFCGQCGTPIIFSAKPVDPTNRQGLLSGNYGNSSIPVGYTGTSQYTPQVQSLQSKNYTGTLQPPTQTYPTGQGTLQPPAQTYPTGQGYGIPPGFTPPPQKRSNLALIIISICIVLALITILAFGAAFLFRNSTTNKGQASHQNATATSIPTPTTAPSPSPTTAPSPTPSPSPTLTSAPTPDVGFSLCDNICTSNGFSVEYPNTWSQNPTADSTGTQFTNPTQSDEFAAFKTPGVIPNMTAGQLVNNDLNNFASQPGYNEPTPTSSPNATIGGENWSFQIAYYQLNSQTVRIEIYATIYQSKSYIIELQALDSNFETVNTQYFERMLGRFQFQ
jgi:hypothetical protein